MPLTRLVSEVPDDAWQGKRIHHGQIDVLTDAVRTIKSQTWRTQPPTSDRDAATCVASSLSATRFAVELGQRGEGAESRMV